jgi:hypothetical protein
MFITLVILMSFFSTNAQTITPDFKTAQCIQLDRFLNSFSTKPAYVELKSTKRQIEGYSSYSSADILVKVDVPDSLSYIYVLDSTIYMLSFLWKGEEICSLYLSNPFEGVFIDYELPSKKLYIIVNNVETEIIPDRYQLVFRKIAGDEFTIK